LRKLYIDSQPRCHQQHIVNLIGTGHVGVNITAQCRPNGRKMLVAIVGEKILEPVVAEFGAVIRTVLIRYAITE